MPERWGIEPTWDRTDNVVETQKRQYEAQGQLVEIEDTGTADSLNTIRHGLGRLPRGVRIVNAVVAAGADVCWYRLTTDDDWTESVLTLRFRSANTRVLLEIF